MTPDELRQFRAGLLFGLSLGLILVIVLLALHIAL